MKMITRTILGVALLAGFCFETSYCFAGGFMGVSGFTLDADEVSFQGAELNAGYRTDIVEVRGSYMVSGTDDSLYGATVELDSMYSVMAIVNVPTEGSLVPYAMIGSTWAEVKASYRGYSATASDTFSTYGLGLRFDARESFSLFVEAKRVGSDSNALNAGISFNF